MLISLIMAMDRRGLIGTATGLPWHLPHDLKRFRAITTGKPIVMGRRTLEHIGRPLPDRANVVLTHRRDFAPEGIVVAHSVEEAIVIARCEAQYLRVTEVVVIGGGEVYAAFLPFVERLYVTVVDGEFEGTTLFPVEMVDWSKFGVTATEHHPANAKNPHPHTFWQLDRGATGDPASAARLGLTA